MAKNDNDKGVLLGHYDDDPYDGTPELGATDKEILEMFGDEVFLKELREAYGDNITDEEFEASNKSFTDDLRATIASRDEDEEDEDE